MVTGDEPVRVCPSTVTPNSPRKTRACTGAGGHEVELTGADVGDGAEGVAVFDGSGEDPAGGLQAGVGVRGDAHAAGDGNVVGAVVVDEAPGAHHAAVAGGQ